MAEILINRVALPPKGERLMISVLSNGSVAYKLGSETAEHRTTAQELPTHGRLGDLDKLYEVATAPYGNLYGFEALIKDIKNAPTIIEASKEIE